MVCLYFFGLISFFFPPWRDGLNEEVISITYFVGPNFLSLKTKQCFFFKKKKPLLFSNLLFFKKEHMLSINI